MASEESQFVARAERLAGPAGVVGFRAAAAREAAFAPQNLSLIHISEPTRH